MRHFVLISFTAAALLAAGGAGAVQYPIAYDTVLTGLDPAMPCSQVDKAIHWVKLDMSLMQSGHQTFGRRNAAAEIYNTDTSDPHSGDNREVITRDGSNTGGMYGDTSRYGTDRAGVTYGDGRSDDGYANARADYVYLHGLLATCTEDRHS